MMVIDSQIHAYAANTPDRPWAQTPKGWPASASGDEMVAAMDKLGIDGAIFVSSFNLYRYDASYAMEVQRTHPGRFAIVKRVDHENPAVAEVIAEWKKVPGVVGIRLGMVADQKLAPDDPGIDRLLRAAVRHDLAVNLQVGGNMDASTKLMDKHPDTRIVIDHLGFYQPRSAPAPANVWDDLPKVLAMARRPNVTIKVSGVCTMSRQGYPYEDIWDPLSRVFDAFGFERCLWGTDWTRTFYLVNYQQGMEPFLRTPRLSDGERALLMGGACAKAYRWAPT